MHVFIISYLINKALILLILLVKYVEDLLVTNIGNVMKIFLSLVDPEESNSGH